MKLSIFLCYIGLLPLSLLLACQSTSSTEGELVISRTEYAERLEGFWLGQCIANWTGLVTEMDKIGNVGEIRTGAFYTRTDWGQPDQPSIWGEGIPSALSPTIDFVFEEPGGVWSADDDTDIEYMYQYLLAQHETAFLTPQQIRKGWLTHIRTEEENFLWVSNQQALDLMQEGMLPPTTSDPAHNPHYAMIDAQLTTELFGFFAPGRPDIALKMAHLPIRTTARKEAAQIAEFYVLMYNQATSAPMSQPDSTITMQMAIQAREHLVGSEYPARMFDYVIGLYQKGLPWEATRDSIYQRYQVEQKDRYDITSQNLYCNGCFAAGINFAASLVSLFYGKGDLLETIKIGSLCGWDSDNPTATWGGMLGFILGKSGVETAFDRTFADQFNIHRTRQGFPNDGLDNFPDMARTGLEIVDRVVTNVLVGHIDSTGDAWIIPRPRAKK
ncbi:MAG TPA: heme biosynthesis protein HemY [Cytophagales bacterium]|nr:heme biosynthesis protein HemY [Cytophagales bacterium]HAP63096.1 heme biosynthesis protein HemY [Cytophagales bacterium]